MATPAFSERSEGEEKEELLLLHWQLRLQPHIYVASVPSLRGHYQLEPEGYVVGEMIEVGTYSYYSEFRVYHSYLLGRFEVEKILRGKVHHMR